MQKQTLPQRLYETRIASMQRCVAFMVLFHEMGKHVQQFWPMVSFGYLRYDMDRTQSIMRIATTASPVSGMDVHAKMLHMAKEKQKAKVLETVLRVIRTWRRFARDKTFTRMRNQLNDLHLKNQHRTELLPVSPVQSSDAESLSPEKALKDWHMVRLGVVPLGKRIPTASSSFHGVSSSSWSPMIPSMRGAARAFQQQLTGQQEPTENIITAGGQSSSSSSPSNGLGVASMGNSTKGSTWL